MKRYPPGVLRLIEAVKRQFVGDCDVPNCPDCGDTREALRAIESAPDAPADTVPRELFDRACELVKEAFYTKPYQNWELCDINKQLAALRAQADGRKGN